MLLRKIFSISNLTLLTALVLSGIAAWYSIVGLTAIFAAAVIPVIIMGASLEIAKVVTTVWLHRFWSQSGLLIKLYLIPAVLVLAVITSMGIFGFLSKAHLDQAKPAGNNTAKIERIDLQLDREKRKITDAEKVISQLDKAVQVLLDNDRIRGPDGAIAVRKSQQEERDNLSLIITQSQTTIDKLEDEKFDLNVAVRDLELEVGPIRYVAELIYEDAENNLEKAVRGVIILLVVVFDPLALCLVLASLKARKIEYAEIEDKYKKDKESIPVVIPDAPVIEDKEIQNVTEDNLLIDPVSKEDEVVITDSITVEENKTESVEELVTADSDAAIEPEKIEPTIQAAEDIVDSTIQIIEDVVEPTTFDVESGIKKKKTFWQRLKLRP